MLTFVLAATNVLDFYLDDKQKNHLVEIEHLAMENTEKANAKLAGYVREALRLNPIVSLYDPAITIRSNT